jgi:hypothetical protein
MLFTVAALMAAMLAASASPAFARTLEWCNPPDHGNYWAASLYVCDGNGNLVNESGITPEEWEQLEKQLLEYQ